MDLRQRKRIIAVRMSGGGCTRSFRAGGLCARRHGWQWSSSVTTGYRCRTHRASESARHGGQVSTTHRGLTCRCRCVAQILVVQVGVIPSKTRPSL